jgi:hypothetical protein
MREEEKAYLAGFLEADGCISIRKFKRNKRRRKDYYGGVVSIVNTNKGILEYFHKLIGKGTIHVLCKGTAKWKRSYRYQINGREASKVLAEIRPYMKMKYKQADLFCEMYDVKQNHMTQEQYDKAEQRYEEIKVLVAALNKKGP